MKDYNSREIVKSLLSDTFVSLFYFFLLLIITLCADQFLKFLLYNLFEINSTEYLSKLYIGIKSIIITLEAITFLAFFVSQFVKGLKELKFICKDL